MKSKPHKFKADFYTPPMTFGSNKLPPMMIESKSIKFQEIQSFYTEIQKLHAVPPSYLWPSASVTLPTNKFTYGKVAEKTMAKSKAKTQKARGVMYGLEDLFAFNNQKNYYGLTRFMKRAKHTVILKEEDIKYNGKLPCFARPCPKKPRHGFVDSKVVKNNKEILKMWKEARKIDPEAELILGPYVPSVKYNAVYVSSGSLSIGIGNDGATGGKNAINFPVAPHKFKPNFIKKAGLRVKDAVYLEAICRPSGGVIDNRRWLLAQARGGPKLNAASSDFIPKKMKVKKIVTPHDDLVKWEKDVAKFAPGTVVYGPGHTLASHAAIHCVLNKVPFITGDKPVVGTMLVPKAASRTKLNRAEFKRGVRTGINICKTFDYEDLLKYFYYSLSVLHNWAYIRQSQSADWLLGTAATLYCKIGTALVQGEFRHMHKTGLGREQTYKKSMREGKASLGRLPDMFKDFYSGYWSSGFGGIPWATCAWYMTSLWNEITKSFNKNTATLNDQETAKIMGIMNGATNAAHNNGWWFNKFACKADLDFVANHSGLAAFMVSDVYYDLNKRVRAIKSVKQKLPSVKRVNAPCGTTEDGRVAWLYMHYLKKSTELKLKMDNGSTKYHTVKLTAKEYEGIRRKYDREDKDPYGDKLYLNIKANGKFRLPGGKDRILRKVFA